VTGVRARLPERNLDVLRALAVLCVLADHVAIAATPPGNIAWGWLGRAGVLIFFVHTALVLMSSLERSGGTLQGWVWRFYIRRALRIYPLAIFTIILVLAAGIPPHTPHAGLVARFVAPDNGTIVANLLLMQNLVRKSDVLGVLWTLPIEVQMYLALPFCFLVARRSVAAVGALILASVVVGLAFVTDAPIPGLWRLPMVIYGPCFLSGVLAYSIIRRSVSRRIAPQLWFVAFGALLAAFSVVGSHYENVVAQWTFCVAIGLTLPFAADSSASWVTSVAHVLAKYSYGIYLLHLPMLWIALVVFREAPLMAQWLIFAALMIAGPWIAYHLIERPGIWLGQRLVHQPMPAHTPVGAP
jgi:peptidoglycan/LPS O-acetylase OafA/YrhL